MAIKPAICTQCGGKLEIDDNLDAAICKFCGTPFIVEKAINNFYSTHNVINNIENANFCGIDKNIELRRAIGHLKLGNFNTAREAFTKLTDYYPEYWAGWFGMAIIESSGFDYTLDYCWFDDRMPFYNYLTNAIKTANNETTKEALKSLQAKINQKKSQYNEICNYHKNLQDKKNIINEYMPKCVYVKSDTSDTIEYNNIRNVDQLEGAKKSLIFSIVLGFLQYYYFLPKYFFLPSFFVFAFLFYYFIS